MDFPETGCRQGYKVESMIGVNFYFSYHRCPVFVYAAPDDVFHLGRVLRLTIPLEGVL